MAGGKKSKRTNARGKKEGGARVAALAKEISRLSINNNSQPRRRRPRRGGRGMECGAGVPAAYASRSRIGGNGPIRPIGNGGRIKITRDELLCSVSTTHGKTETVNSFDLIPGSGVMPFLFRLSSCYQRIRWLRAHITWRASCGTSTNGIISYGVAFNNGQSVTTRDLVTALTPCNDHPVWQSGVNNPLVIPPSMLMSRRWYILNSSTADKTDMDFGRFCYGLTHGATTADSRGEFWISYTVEMEGTNPA